MKTTIPTDDNVAEISVTYATTIPTHDRVTVAHSHQAVEVLRYIWDDGKMELQESFKVILLNRKNHVLGVVTISDGGRVSTQVDIRFMFGIILKSASVAIILAHNHPSGNRYPSESDMQLSQKIIEVAKLHDICILDHIILTAESYYSFADEGLLNISYHITTKTTAS